MSGDRGESFNVNTHNTRRTELMKHARPFTGVLALTGIVMLLSPPSHAQLPPTFRPTPIAETGFVVNPDTTGRIGMNNLGEIVYGVGNNGFLWLPEPNYNLAAGLHDLNSISDRTGDCLARGINDHGFVIGTFGGTQTVEGEAIVWNLNERDANDKIVTTLLDANDEFVWSGGFGISNHDSNPLIVGIGGLDGSCASCAVLEEGGPDPLNRVGFAVRLDDAPLDANDFLETTAHNSLAWDVTETGTTVAGRFQCVSDFCNPPGTPTCDGVPGGLHGSPATP